MKCTNEEPCGNCDICDMEPGDDTCPHGEHHVQDCFVCNPDGTCDHGVNVREIECEACADENEVGIELECEHDEQQDQCKICNDY